MAPIRLLLAAVAVAALAVACSDDDSTTEGRQDPAAARRRPRCAGGGTATTLMSTGRPRTRPRRHRAPPRPPSRHCRQQIRAHDRRLFRPARGSRRRPATEVTTKIPCDEPHDAQIFSRLSYPAEPGELYPGDDIVEDYALAACYLRFEAWADAIYETSALEIRAFTPTRDDFEAQSYRGIQCFVERNDGDKLVGTSRSSGL